jgi:S1-C subfamily serine protease
MSNAGLIWIANRWSVQQFSACVMSIVERICFRPPPGMVEARPASNRRSTRGAIYASLAFLAAYALLSVPTNARGEDSWWCGIATPKRLSTVYIEITLEDLKTGEQKIEQQTGVVVGKDGYVLTAGHGLKKNGSKEIRDKDGKVVGTEPVAYRDPPQIDGALGTNKSSERLVYRKLRADLDLALLQFQNFSAPRSALLIGRASEIGLQELAVAGYPFAKDWDCRKAAISSKDGSGPGWNLETDLIQGMSGAPLMNAQGDLVGIFLGRDNNDPTRKYGIPINRAIEFISEAEPKMRGLFGTLVEATTPALATAQYETTRLELDTTDEPPPSPGDFISRPHTSAFPLPASRKVVKTEVVIDEENGLKDHVVRVETTSTNFLNASYILVSGPGTDVKSLGHVKGHIVVVLEPAPGATRSVSLTTH